ncbi:MAG: hypothetical protein M3151_11950, partial [Actinomycetota bacterium]|nr:hypothetical protein [Actinomycetota bacterium]
VRDSLELLKTHEAQMLDDLRLFVEQEMPSTDKALLDTFARFLTAYADERAGGRAEILPAEDFEDHVRVRWGDEGGESPILLLGHYDTVWPTGTLREMPFVDRDGLATGPGIFDSNCALKLHDQSDPLRTGTTVNVGVVSRGSVD